MLTPWSFDLFHKFSKIIKNLKIHAIFWSFWKPCEPNQRFEIFNFWHITKWIETPYHKYDFTAHTRVFSPWTDHKSICHSLWLDFPDMHYRPGNWLSSKNHSTIITVLENGQGTIRKSVFVSFGQHFFIVHPLIQNIMGKKFHYWYRIIILEVLNLYPNNRVFVLVLYLFVSVRNENALPNRFITTDCDLSSCHFLL